MQEKARTKPLRLALVASGHTVSDYTTVLERIMLGLADESIPVALICPPRVDVDAMIPASATIIRYPFIELPLAGSYNRKKVREELAAFEPTVMHCLCESMAMFTRRITRRLDLPYILSVNSLQRRWLNFSVSTQRCSAIISPAQTVESRLKHLHPRMGDLIRRLEYGTFIADGPHCFADPTRTPSLVISHPIHNADDFEPLLGSIRHLVIDGYEFVVVFTGSGRAESKLHAMFKAFDLVEHVTHVPGLSSWPKILAAADIFIRPRPLPWFDTYLLEAMATGSAVAACTGGVDDLIVADKTAAVFDPTDELSITTTLKRLLGRREEARSLAESAVRSLRQTHTASQMVDGLLRLYHKAHRQNES